MALPKCQRQNRSFQLLEFYFRHFANATIQRSFVQLISYFDYFLYFTDQVEFYYLIIICISDPQFMTCN
jgi:hypothetical protein